MPTNTHGARRLGRTDLSSNPDRRFRADFARQATIAAFGWCFARALDQADFIDRQTSEPPRPSPEARFP